MTTGSPAPAEERAIPDLALPADPWLPDTIRRFRAPLLRAWQSRIAESPVLRPEGPAGFPLPPLESFLDLVLRQLDGADDHAALRKSILGGALEGFTPDAACRLHLCLKAALLDLLEGDSAPTPGAAAHAAAAMDEVLLRLAQFAHERRHGEVRAREQERDRILNFTQERLRTLLDTMNEGFTGVDAAETITIFNRRMEQITGYTREEMLGEHFHNLYAPECLEQVRAHLGRRRQGQSSTYQTELLRKDGRRLPVRISGAPLRDHLDGYIGSFAVVTDIGEQLEAENRLRRTNAEIARLLERERKRAAHFAIVNQVARLVLSTLDPQEIFQRVVHAVVEHFNYHHAALFLVREATGELVVHAQAGAYAGVFPEGYVQRAGTGIVGTVVASGESLLAGDAAADPRRVLAFPEEARTGAELCVPIRMGNRVLGALDVQTTEKDAFDENDLASLKILADQLAWVIHNAQLYQQTRELKEFNEQVLHNTPMPILLLDAGFVVVSANQSYLEHQSRKAEDILGRPLERAVPDSFLVSQEGRRAIETVLSTGTRVSLERRVVPLGAYRNRVIDVHISPLETRDRRLALVVIDDLTETLDKAYESALLRGLVQVTQGILDLDRLLHAVLTCVTAGTALRFNRAILLLADRQKGVLEGRIGVGPSTPAEAARIWSDMGQKNLSVGDILSEYDSRGLSPDTPLSAAARQIRIPLDDPDDILARCVRERKTFRVTEQDALAISPSLWAALGTHHFVAVPLVSRDRTVGLLLADNLYSGAPITDDSVDLLTAFAGHAAMALENAELFHQLEQKIEELQRTREELVHSERLAVIGQLSARIAHEIRNPLATIGGFARAILRRPEPERVNTAARIIADEVSRLESLLQDTLSFTRPSVPDIAPCDLAALLSSVREMVRDDLEAAGITYVDRTDARLPPVPLDPAQFKQVFLNVVQNAAQAMPQGGHLTVRTALDEKACARVDIEDTGEGIREKDRGQIFSPFFTTKTYGTGLGLAISKKIVEDHHGRIEVDSAPGRGTTIRIRIPLQQPEAEPPR